MLLACLMSFRAGQEWQAREAMTVVEKLLATQAEKQQILEARVDQLVLQYGQIAERLDSASKNLKQVIDETKNGQKTSHQP